MPTHGRQGSAKMAILEQGVVLRNTKEPGRMILPVRGFSIGLVDSGCLGLAVDGYSDREGADLGLIGEGEDIIVINVLDVDVADTILDVGDSALELCIVDGCGALEIGLACEFLELDLYDVDGVSLVEGVGGDTGALVLVDIEVYVAGGEFEVELVIIHRGDFLGVGDIGAVSVCSSGEGNSTKHEDHEGNQIFLLGNFLVCIHIDHFLSLLRDESSGISPCSRSVPFCKFSVLAYAYEFGI